MIIDVSRFIVAHHAKVPYETAISKINFNKHVAIVWTQRVINDLLDDDDIEIFKSAFPLCVMNDFPDHRLLAQFFVSSRFNKRVAKQIIGQQLVKISRA